MTSEGEKRKLVDLRVVDLRAELEKRGLENKGVKATLIERLQKVLRDEGHDPEDYLFEIEPGKTPKRSNMKRGEQDTESETQSNADENHDTSMEVDEEGKEKEEEEDNAKIENGKEKETKDSLKSGDQEEKKDSKDESQKPSASGKSGEKPEEKLASVNQGADGGKSIPEANGADNEDSINLTIGEDEEKLLADEVGHEEDSSSQKEGKDEGERGGVNPEEGTAGGDGKKQAAGQKEDKDTAGEDGKQEKAQEENRDDKGGEKGKSSLANADQKQSKDVKDKRTKPSTTAGRSRNLWVSGLSSSTRATDLKQVFSKHGKVIGAKVVTNARTPGARCYGYVTMATSEDASKCIQHLHRTELHGRMVSVERAKGDAAGPPKKGTDSHSKIDEKKKLERKLNTSSKTEEKKADKDEKQSEQTDIEKTGGEKDEGGAPGEELKVKEEPKDEGEKEKEESEAEKEGTEHRRSEDKSHSREVSRDRRERHRSAGSSHYSHRSQHSHHSHRSRPHSRSPHRRVFRSGSPSRRPGVLTFTQIREERERQRLHEREREFREEDRRRRDEMARQRDIEKRQREEGIRLEREKERLRIERELIDSERAELMRLERERQRTEREKLEREREELKRQQMRFEEDRRTTKRPADDRRDSYPEERKRVATDSRYEGSRPTRFEDNARFERGGPSFRVRDERRAEGDHRPKVEMRHSTRDRYADSAEGEGRYSERAGDSWHAGGGPPPVKPFNSLSGSGPSRDSWGASGDRKSDGGQSWGRPMESGSSDRWVSGGSGPMGVGRSGPNMGPPDSMYEGQQNAPPVVSYPLYSLRTGSASAVMYGRELNHPQKGVTN